MSLANKLQRSVSIDNDAELLALESLLCNEDESNKTKICLPQTAPPKDVYKTVPRLRDDSTFVDAFSYEVPSAELIKASESVTKIEEIDSSDDEEVKNFLERKYNQYGSDINKKLKQQRESAHEAKVEREIIGTAKSNRTEDLKDSATKTDPNMNIKGPHNPIKRQSNVNSSFQKQAPSEAASKQSKLTATFSTSATYTDPIFGLRIINPLISSALLVERMSGRKAISFSSLIHHIEHGDLSKDWVIAGVLVAKNPVRLSKKGDPYSSWRMSDLRGDIKMISLFLFGGAHKELWKTAEGICLAILNPNILEKRAATNDAACFSIDSAQKVMILGQSKDLGKCKATKKNGDKCTAVVNLGECDYCVFHVKNEFNKMSKRSELQSATAGRGLNELRNKVLGKSEVFYGGQSFSAIPARKSAKMSAKDSQRMSYLSEYAVSPFASSINHRSSPKGVTTVPYAARGGPISKMASNVEASAKQRQKDLERLKILQAENEKFNLGESLSSQKNVLPNVSCASASTITAAATSMSSIVVPDKYKNREFSSAARSIPRLSSENFFMEVNVGTQQAQTAKLKAAQVLKQCPIERPNPNSIRGSKNGKRRAIDKLNEKYRSNSAKLLKLDQEEQEAKRKSRIERIMAATSTHTNLVDLRQQQTQSEYFDKLEKKEAMEDKMLSTYKIPCKAVICQRCKYTAFTAADRCKEEKHPLKVVDAEKRFFQCKDCGNRTATVFKMPKMSCKNCKGSRWERSAMIRERKVFDGKERLSIRGDEETFIGSLAGNANLNLLVPDE